MTELTEKYRSKRKLFLALPLLVLPFLTLLFWGLGGGGAKSKQKTTTTGGLNTKLPSPELQEGFGNKMSLYERAARDSMRWADQSRSDPYNAIEDTSYNSQEDTGFFTHQSETAGTEQKIRAQLAVLQKRIDETQEVTDTEVTNNSSSLVPDTDAEQDINFTDISPAVGDQADPDLARLDRMLQTILDIQHPERVSERLQEKSRKQRGVIYPVFADQSVPGAELLQPDPQTIEKIDQVETRTARNAFYDDANGNLENTKEMALLAVVDETQTLLSGATLKLRLSEDIFINGIKVPKGNFIYGLCTLSGQRLQVNIQTIRYQNNLLPVNLSVYDMDGMEGIHVPGAISRDAAKQGMRQGVQSLDFYNMDPSFGAQAASAGIQTAKSLLGHKARLVKVTVRAGYPVLLADNNNRQ